MSLRFEQDYSAKIIASRWGRYSQRVYDALRVNIKSYLERIGLEAIKRYFPKGGGGVLEGELKVTDISEGYRVMFRISTDDPELDMLVRILEYGSPPHTISPRQALALHFRPEALRMYQGPNATMPYAIHLDYVFANRVNHPGNRAYRMYQNGLNDIRTEIIDVIKRTHKEVLQDIMREKQ